MPPRAVKKTGNSSGGKKAVGRAAKGTTKAQNQNQQQVIEEIVKIEVKEEEIKVEETVVEQKQVEIEMEVPSQPEPESKSEENGTLANKEDKDVQEAFEEDDKGERLDLEDDDVEYDPEEEVGVDYDEKEIENEEPHEEGDGEEHPEEGDVGEQEEEDMVEEEMEDIGEETEIVREEEHAEEEHEELGDRENEEHHEVVKERRKRKEFEVFVGGLDKDASEDDLKKVFSAVGEIVEVRLMMNPQTKKNKGFAFLRFATVEQAKRAVKEMRNPVVHGKKCGVTPSQDSDTLFLGNICKTWTKEALKEKLSQYGIENVEDLTLVEDTNNEGMNRGFAFLEFSSRSDAMDAYKRLQKRDVVFGVDRNAKVAFADSFIEPDDEIMAQVKTVFVDGLPASWDEDRVKEHLKKFGEIEKVELARNMPSAKRKDFGFVSFDTHDNAVICAESINNAELGDGDNKVKVRARLSRPLQRGRGKHVSRGDFRSGRVAPRASRVSWIRPAPRSLPPRSLRGVGSRLPPSQGHGFKGPVGYRDRRPVMDVPERVRPLPPPVRSYARKPVPSYPRSSSKREFDRRDELPPRSRVPVDYGSRAAPERRSSYKVDYAPRGSSYPDDVARGSTRAAPRRAYVDEGYERRFERPPPSYREGRPRDYDSMSGTKRQYSALEDVPPRYADAGVRQSRARLDYGVGGSSSQYADTYSDRVGRSQLGGYAGRSSLSAQESHAVYGSRQGMSYAGGSYGGSDAGGAYSSSYGSQYMSRGPDIGDSSYSSLYSSRNLGGSSYLGGGGSGSYY
ncbi:hypothetical protein AQUCO_05300104v1 [Aquilegia coerulea]|uniref:RRM domain-containing protein n=1 Tax=Aquilegia coerulea TaxID=218851 RepID=A0A2G5CIC1_AQUCA|nr:hypothetical protein AQUCO_05300104v1 [Aquilegia coerulea]PIA31042.1 hypothetical protein AQUCO_05300104v1 [Aquilegia coerulea]